MAIVPLLKVTLYGPLQEKARVLESLQEYGCLHLVDLRGAGLPRQPRGVVSVETHQALKYLQASPLRRRAARDDSDFRLHEVVQQAEYLERRQETLLDERDELRTAIETLQPWGNFQLPPAREWGGLRFWFYIVPHYRRAALKSREEVWQVVAEDHRYAYVAVLSSEEPQGMPVPRTELDRRPLRELREQTEQVEAELEDLHWQRVQLTRWIDAIQRCIAEADDAAWQHHAAQLSWEDPHLFALQGWIPVRERARIQEWAQTQGLALVLESPRLEENPPTLLENSRLFSGGTDAVTFYMTPAYHSWDPSGMVFVFFSLFFAMILSDAGYALVLGGFLLLLWNRLGESVAGRRMRRLASAIVVTSGVYGVLVGNYFGWSLVSESLLGRWQVLDGTDMQLMMRLTISLGVLHLVLANLAVAWQQRHSLRWLASLGWVMALWGGLLLGLHASAPAQHAEQAVEFGPALEPYGLWLLTGGLVGVLLFSSARPLWPCHWRDWGGRLVDGLLALTLIPRAFGDVLSYLRLFALGLASSTLATTFNELTAQVGDYAGVGALLALLVVVCGHSLNLVLSTVGGVVHGLRLNCIEFFGWGLTEEGYPFQPFSKKTA